MKALGEIRVEERDGVIALITRTTTRPMPWHVWLIIEVPNEERHWREEDCEHLTYGHPRFTAVRGLAEFYVRDITFFKARYGSTLTRAGAERRARRRLERFLKWRAKQQAVQAALAAAEAEAA